MENLITTKGVIKREVLDFEKEIKNLFKLIEVLDDKFQVYKNLEDVVTETKDEFMRVHRDSLNEDEIKYIMSI